jgi:hypothetical protein
MITFVLVFFVAAFMPYFDLQHQKEGTLGDNIIRNLTELNRLASEQEDISKSIQNYFDVPTLAAINDYKSLDDYFRKLELLQSEGIASSKNLSVNQLETIVPTFLVCNEEFDINMTKWVSCNANHTAYGVNKKIAFRYQLIENQIDPLIQKAKKNLKSFNLTASPIILDKNNEITSKLPSDIDPISWKQKISNSSTFMNIWVTRTNDVVNFALHKKTAEYIASVLLHNPSSVRISYDNQFRKDFEYNLNSLNQSKNQIEKGIKGLTEKFEEVDFPVVGKVPIGLVNAVVIYPAAVGVGSLICSYYLGQMISKRSLLHRKMGNEFGPKLGTELYPLWVEPLGTKKLFRFCQLMSFISIPLIILIVITYLVHAIPIKQESIFGISLFPIMVVSYLIGFVLTAVGGILIAKKSYEYRLPEPPNRYPFIF